MAARREELERAVRGLRGHRRHRPRDRRRDRSRADAGARRQARARARRGARRPHHAARGRRARGRRAARATRTIADAARLPLAGSTAGEVLPRAAPAHRRRGARAADPARPARRRPRRDGAPRPARLPRPEPRRARRLRPPRGRRRVHARRRAAPGGLRGAARRPRSPPPSRSRPTACRRSLAAAEHERRRWARELHDETLQALGGLKVLLSSAARLDDPRPCARRCATATEQLDRRDRDPARAHHRAAPAGARPARAGAGARARSPAHGAPANGLEVRADVEPARRAPPRRRARDHGLPARPGGADERRQARRRRRVEIAVRCARRRGRRVAWPTTASASTPTAAAGTASGSPACASASSWPAASSSVAPGARGRHRDPRAGCRCPEPSYPALDEPVVERVAHELGAGGAAELLLDVRAVGLDGAHARGRAAAAISALVWPERDQPQDLDLALGEVVGRAVRLGRRGGQRARRAAG